ANWPGLGCRFAIAHGDQRQLVAIENTLLIFSDFVFGIHPRVQRHVLYGKRLIALFPIPNPWKPDGWMAARNPNTVDKRAIVLSSINYKVDIRKPDRMSVEH